MGLPGAGSSATERLRAARHDSESLLWNSVVWQLGVTARYSCLWPLSAASITVTVLAELEVGLVVHVEANHRKREVERTLCRAWILHQASVCATHDFHVVAEGWFVASCGIAIVYVTIGVGKSIPATFAQF